MPVIEYASRVIAWIFCIFTMLLFCCSCSDKNNIDTSDSEMAAIMKNFIVEISGTLADESETVWNGGTDIASGSTAAGKPDGNAGGAYNKLRSWGLVRKPGAAPDADPGTPELLRKYNSFYIGDTDEKKVYLTFDEGYEMGYTSRILDILGDNNVKATFFITGPYQEKHDDLVERMVREGHEVGNHTMRHPSLPALGDSGIIEEVDGLDRIFFEKYKKHMKYLRAPKGEYSERTLDITSRLGYRNVFWSFAYDDWHRDKIRGADYVYDIVMKNIHNGAVILLHAVSKDNADALDSIIINVKRMGYEFGSLKDIE